MRLPEGVNPKYGIFTMDRDFAGKIIDQYAKVNVLKRVKSENEDCAIMKNGTQFKWIKPMIMLVEINALLVLLI